MTRIHVVPHQHFDLIWRREIAWYRARREELFLQALELLTGRSEWTFTFNQILPLREFLENRPEWRERIATLLHSGRLELFGAGLSVPDVNMTHPGALARNCELGRQWLKDQFGVEVVIAGFEDAFGVPAQTPAFLAAAGYRYYKAGRMPRAGREDLSGDFLWEAPDGTRIRCIGNGPAGMSWGWGFSANPDEPVPDIYGERYGRIRDEVAAAVEAALAAGLECSLVTVMGEEQSIFPGIGELIADLNQSYRERGATLEFSTFTRYAEGLDEAYWSRAPVITAATDLSRLFTGCYVSRAASKTAPRRLEHRLLAAEAAGERKLDKHWENLALVHFHDAICGCHIDENAAYLAGLAAESMTELETAGAVIPARRLLPSWRTPQHPIPHPAAGELRSGRWSWRFTPDGRFAEALFDGVSQGPVASIVLREEHGTLWTEEYSGRRRPVRPEEETLISLKQEGAHTEIVSEFFTDAFRDFWPGFSRLRYRKYLRFNADSPLVRVTVETDYLGNSSEIAVRWGDPARKLDTCTAEIPLGSVTRTAYEPILMQGASFPALGFVFADGFGVLNGGTPGHALRDGALETLLQRAPVKRWSPWFPVTPTDAMWDNGPRVHDFVYIAAGDCSPGDRHRLAAEFNALLSCPGCRNQIPPQLEGLPDNLVTASWRAAGNGGTAWIFEAAGAEAVWKEFRFKPCEVKRIVFDA